MTFLFTDVEGSTRRWEADADGMRLALAAHDQALHEAIAAHRGWLFKHTGDGVCAAFSSPRSAVDAAVAAQLALLLPVRMGLATGEAELRGSDYFGAVLNRAARVMAAGHGGQILLAESTAALLDGVDLIDLGPRRLRDVPTPVGLYQVRAPGLRSDFPALRAVDPSPGNLRPAMTSFVGRDTEVAELKTLMRRHRLVTLTGVGGVGKTRLANEVAVQLANEFPDGAWIFELAAVTDPAAVPDAVAGALGITQQPGKNVRDSVAAAMEGRRRLLLLDNCEHLLDAAADLIEAILAHSSTVQILATSREGLGIAEERIWVVPSLQVGSELEGRESSAVRLFVDRAESVTPGLPMSEPGEAGAVVEICRRLDGIPLAIELAASRMASMTATEVRDRLDHRFRLLVGSRRGLQRHHTLRHAVQWSYELLDDAEKSLLEQCSVFAGGFDLQSACALAGSDEVDDYAVLDLLQALVRKSLLVVRKAGGRTRFSMLETIREFAEEQLVAHGDPTEVRSAHARYYARHEAALMALWDSPRQREAYTWFTAELPNLRNAFRWAADGGDLDVAATIATYSAFLGGVWLGISEPIAWAEELIEPARAVDHPRLAFLYVTASLCWWPGRGEDAIGYSDAGQTVVNSGRGDVPFGLAGMLGGAYLAAGQTDRYVAVSRAQLARGRDTHTIKQTNCVLALTAAGSVDEAIAAAAGLIDAAEAVGNPSVLSLALLAYGYAFSEADPGRALDALHRGLAIAREGGDRATEAHLAMSVFRLETEHGDPMAALDYCTVAVRNYHDAGNATQLRAVLGILTRLLDRLGRYRPAAVIAGFAVSAMVTATVPELGAANTHLREVLGDATYESLARQGRTMTTAAVATYAYDQIDQARAFLVPVQLSGEGAG